MKTHPGLMNAYLCLQLYGLPELVYRKSILLGSKVNKFNGNVNDYHINANYFISIVSVIDYWFKHLDFMSL